MIPQIRTVMDVIIRDAYRVGYTQQEHTHYVHVVVRKWTAAIARKFKQDIDVAQELLGKPVYALEEPTNPSLPKFLKLHGFHFHSRTIDVQGRDVAVFERPLPWAAEVHRTPTP